MRLMIDHHIESNTLTKQCRPSWLILIIYRVIHALLQLMLSLIMNFDIFETINHFMDVNQSALTLKISRSNLCNKSSIQLWWMVEFGLGLRFLVSISENLKTWCVSKNEDSVRKCLWGMKHNEGVNSTFCIPRLIEMLRRKSAFWRKKVKCYMIAIKKDRHFSCRRPFEIGVIGRWWCHFWIVCKYK